MNNYLKKYILPAITLVMFMAAAAAWHFKNIAGAELEQAMRQYGQMQTLAAKYQLLSSSKYPRQELSAENLFARVNNISGGLGLSGRIETLRPAAANGGQGESLDLQIRNLYLGEFLRFLDGIEAIDGISIDRMTLNRTGNMLLDLEMRLTRRTAS